MIPVVDLQNFPNVYLEPDQLGKVNAWEYYFCQPCGVSLEEAYAADNVVMGNGRLDHLSPSGHAWAGFYYNANGELESWRELVRLGLLKVQPTMYQSIMDEYHRLISKDDRVLGVKLRGTDYIAVPAGGHAKQPNVEDAIRVIAKLKSDWGCNKIFLATEDKNIFERCKQAFGDALITSTMNYVDYDGKRYIGLYNVDRKDRLFLNGKEYLTQMVILSKCNCLLTSMCNGAAAAMMMSDGFEHVHVFDLGRY